MSSGIAIKSGKSRFVLVTRQTRMQELIIRFNSWPQAKFYLEHSQSEVQDYLDEHDLYIQKVSQTEAILNGLGRVQKLERGFLANYQFSPQDIVVVVGQDGLVANTLKYLDGQPIIGINPDPQRWDGKLLKFNVDNFKPALLALLANELTVKNITFAEAKTNDGQTMLAVNDLFIGPKTHSSACYSLSWAGQTEQQSSSGIIVSTGFGSTGWLSSVLAGAFGITSAEQTSLKNGFNWQAKKLLFAVREPFVSQTSSANIVFGAVTDSKPLVLESYMPEKGVIFSDGIEEDFIAFNAGTVLTVGVSNKQGRLVF